MEYAWTQYLMEVNNDGSSRLVNRPDICSSNSTAKSQDQSSRRSPIVVSNAVMTTVNDPTVRLQAVTTKVTVQEPVTGLRFTPMTSAAGIPQRTQTFVSKQGSALVDSIRFEEEKTVSKQTVSVRKEEPEIPDTMTSCIPTSELSTGPIITSSTVLSKVAETVPVGKLIPVSTTAEEYGDELKTGKIEVQPLMTLPDVLSQMKMITANEPMSDQHTHVPATSTGDQRPATASVNDLRDTDVTATAIDEMHTCTLATTTTPTQQGIDGLLAAESVLKPLLNAYNDLENRQIVTQVGQYALEFDQQAKISAERDAIIEQQPCMAATNDAEYVSQGPLVIEKNAIKNYCSPAAAGKTEFDVGDEYNILPVDTGNEAFQNNDCLTPVGQHGERPVILQSPVQSSTVTVTSSYSSSCKFIGAAPDKCKKCGQRIYEMEKLLAEHSCYHKQCFRCFKCQQLLRLDNYISIDGFPHCRSHLAEAIQCKPRNSVTGVTMLNEPSAETCKNSNPELGRSVSFASYGFISNKSIAKSSLATVSTDSNDDLAAITRAFKTFRSLEKENAKSQPEPEINEKRKFKVNTDTSWQAPRSYLVYPVTEANKHAAVLDNATGLWQCFKNSANKSELYEKRCDVEKKCNLDVGNKNAVGLNRDLDEAKQTKTSSNIAEAHNNLDDECSIESIKLSKALAKFKDLEKKNLNQHDEKRILLLNNRRPSNLVSCSDDDVFYQPKSVTQDKVDQIQHNLLQKKLMTDQMNNPDRKFLETVFPPRKNALNSSSDLRLENFDRRNSSHEVSCKPGTHNEATKVAESQRIATSMNVDYPSIKYTQNLLPKWKMLEQAFMLSEYNIKSKRNPVMMNSNVNVLISTEKDRKLENERPVKTSSSKLDIQADNKPDTRPDTRPDTKRDGAPTETMQTTNRETRKQITNIESVSSEKKMEMYVPTTLAFTRKQLVKFRELEAHAQLTKTAEAAYKIKKTFKWDVKEPAHLRRLANTASSGESAPALTRIPAEPVISSTALPDVVSDQPSFPPMGDMKSILIRFRAMEELSRTSVSTNSNSSNSFPHLPKTCPPIRAASTNDVFMLSEPVGCY